MRPPVAMTIAGSDPSGGAGIQADLKAFSAIGAYGCACMTSLTSQNTVGVRGVHTVPEDFVVAQIEPVLDDLPVDATKIGMLGTSEIIRALARLMRDRRAEFGTVVLDPVMVATSGDPLLTDDADAALREDLLPLADLITPNLPEGARLLGRPEDVAGTVEQMRDQALELLDLGPRAVLLKGGHLHREDEDAVDVLAIRGPGSAHAGSADAEPADAGSDVEPVVVELTGRHVDTRNTHGTGCTLSSAIAAFAARWSRSATTSSAEAPASETEAAETPAPETPAAEAPTRIDDAALTAAVRDGKAFLTRALADGAAWRLSRTPDAGHGPVNHLSQTLR